jgi:hypothetical protein
VVRPPSRLGNVQVRPTPATAPLDVYSAARWLGPSWSGRLSARPGPAGGCGRLAAGGPIVAVTGARDSCTREMSFGTGRVEPQRSTILLHGKDISPPGPAERPTRDGGSALTPRVYLGGGPGVAVLLADASAGVSSTSRTEPCCPAISPRPPETSPTWSGSASGTTRRWPPAHAGANPLAASPGRCHAVYSHR